MSDPYDDVSNDDVPQSDGALPGDGASGVGGGTSAGSGGFGDGPDASSPRAGLAWERREQLGAAAAVFGTIREVVFSPTTAFRSMRREGGWAEPLSFAALIGSVAVWAAQAWDMLIRALLVGFSGTGVEEIAAANLAEVWFALFAPLFVCAATFFGAALVHVLLLMLGGAPRPYETTFRVVCYSWSVGVFNLVPICGVLVGTVWRVVVQIIGVREAQSVPTGRAAAAVLIPVLLACFCLVLVVVASLSVVSLAQMGLQ